MGERIPPQSAPDLHVIDAHKFNHEDFLARLRKRKPLIEKIKRDIERQQKVSQKLLDREFTV